MAEVDDSTERLNGVSLEFVQEDEPSYQSKPIPNQDHITLYAIFNRLINHIFFPNQDESTTFFHRIKLSFSENLPLLPEASRNTGHDILLWTRRGTPLRALLVVSVGTVTLLALTGFLVFMLFFLAATINAIVISFFVSLAAVGVFLAFFFTFVTAIYLVAVSIAAFVISTASISAIIAALFVTGWIGFFYTIWLLIKKSADLASHSLIVTGSAVSAFSSARHAQTYNELNKISD